MEYENIDELLETRKGRIYVRGIERIEFKEFLKEHFAKIMIGKINNKECSPLEAAEDYVDNYLKTYELGGMCPANGELEEFHKILAEDNYRLVVDPILRKIREYPSTT